MKKIEADLLQSDFAFDVLDIFLPDIIILYRELEVFVQRYPKSQWTLDQCQELLLEILSHTYMTKEEVKNHFFRINSYNNLMFKYVREESFF